MTSLPLNASPADHDLGAMQTAINAAWRRVVRFPFMTTRPDIPSGRVGVAISRRRRAARLLAIQQDIAAARADHRYLGRCDICGAGAGSGRT